MTLPPTEQEQPLLLQAPSGGGRSKQEKHTCLVLFQNTLPGIGKKQNRQISKHQIQ